jgi:hypothetical protein
MGNTVTYQGITQEQFTALDEKAEKLLNMSLAGNVGQASADGVTLAWSYNPTTQILAFDCLKKPFFVTMGLVRSHLDSLVKG